MSDSSPIEEDVLDSAAFESEELISAVESVEITPNTPTTSNTVGLLNEKLKKLSSLLKPDVTTPSKLEISDVNIEAYTKRRGMDGKDYAVYPIIVTMSNGYQYTLEKRYQEFLVFKNDLLLVRPELQNLPFPKKIWLFNLTDVVLNLRLEKLREYLKAILLVAPRPLELNIFLNVANYCARLSRSMSKVVSPASSEKQSPLSPMNDHKFCSLNFKMTVDNFTFLKVLGKGSFGKVYLVRPNGAPKSELYAMKVLRKSEVVKKQQINHTQQERQIMAVVSHPYLLSLRCAFQTDTKLYMITDYCPGGELFFHLKKMHRFTEGMMRYYCAQLVLALRHLHSHSIVYRDLKPENILLDRYGNCKLTDFGLSKMNHKERDPMSTFCGTPEYLSPEMILHRDSGYGYGYEIDWWALGVVCYELICGWPPFFDRDFYKMCEKIMTRPLLFPAKDKIVVSPDAQGFITQFLQREPFKRLGFGKKGFNDIKNQAFFAYVDWNQMEMGLGSPPFIPSMGKTATDTCNFDNDFTKLEINDLHESSPPDKSYLDSIQDSDQIFKTFSFIDIVYTGNISLQNEVADDGEDSRNYDFNDTFNSPMK